MKIPVNPEPIRLPMANLTPEQKAEETAYLLDLWSRGEASTRDTARRLGMTYRDFIEFCSARGYSVSR